VLLLILDLYYRIYLMMDVLLLRFNVNVIHLRNISDYCGQLSEQKLCERMRQRVSAPVYNGCLAWYNVLLIPLFIQA